MNSRWRICLGLAALFGANLFALSVLLWLTETWLRGVRWTGPLLGGLAMSQIFVLGLWLALGDSKWYWRLAVGAFGTMLLVQMFVWSEAFHDASRRDKDPPGGWITLVLMCVLLISAMGLWPLRRLGQWRLTWRCELQPAAVARQYGAGDLLVWTALIGGVLASFRFLQSLTGDNDAGWIKFIFLSLSLLLLIALAASAAFAKERPARHYLILLASTLLIGGLHVGWDVWDGLQVAVSAPWQTRLWPTFRDSFNESLPFPCASVVGLANCLALRFFGCRLSRPGSAGAAALPEEYNGP